MAEERQIKYMAKSNKILIGLIGNPNVGKSTLFNALTGSKQHTGNWPGKTVEKKEGEFTCNNQKIKLVDLPGSYSLTPYTEEEEVASNFVFQKKPDIVIQIIDAQNLERNLFMTIQLLELGAPLVLALNMIDLAKLEGIKINHQELSNLLGIPVINIDAKKETGLNNLIKAALEKSKLKKEKKTIKLTYSTEINKKIKKIKKIIRKNDNDIKNINFLSLKLLENDKRIVQQLAKKPYYSDLKKEVNKNIKHLTNFYNKDISTILANTRYGFIKGLSKDVLKRKNKKKNTKWLDKVDNLVTNKYFGVPLFLIIAWLLFQSTFKLSEPLVNLIENLFGWIGKLLFSLLEKVNTPEWIISLIIDGILGGVGGVLTFVPIIGILFFLIALLEQSGYMTRVAYVMDKLMHRLGLHGKAFIPLIISFGCNVPGVMATRTLQNKSDRLLTILISPFMSCGARLPVYALFAGAFFSAHQGLIIFSMYFLGIMVAIVMGLFFKKILFKKLSSPFVIELPPYRLPAIKGILIYVWERIWIFIKKAGTVILLFSIIIWFLASIPLGVDYGSQDSLAGFLGQKISPIFEPLGFGNWQTSVALMFGFVAKEVVVGILGTLYGINNIESETGATSLSNSLQSDFTPLSAYAFIVFVLLYIPCIAMLATVRRETNSNIWPLFMIGYTTTIAWIMAFIIYQGGKFLGFG